MINSTFSALKSKDLATLASYNGPIPKCIESIEGHQEKLNTLQQFKQIVSEYPTKLRKNAKTKIILAILEDQEEKINSEILEQKEEHNSQELTLDQLNVEDYKRPSACFINTTTNLLPPVILPWEIKLATSYLSRSNVLPYLSSGVTYFCYIEEKHAGLDFKEFLMSYLKKFEREPPTVETPTVDAAEYPISFHSEENKYTYDKEKALIVKKKHLEAVEKRRLKIC